MNITIFDKEQIVDGFTVKKDFIGLSEDGKFIAFSSGACCNNTIKVFTATAPGEWTGEWVTFSEYPEITRAVSWLEDEQLENEKATAINSAVGISLYSLCQEKFFQTTEWGNYRDYRYADFPGVYKVEEIDPSTGLTCGYTYELVTKDRYKELMETSM
ncbi:hypothetical protein HMPREF3191_00888 [Veillonellaceae bacterium DNF00626]|nr:hypothetical protein HMPREF3191_00888 [Veillonellaceae bacterium DNF00626]